MGVRVGPPSLRNIENEDSMGKPIETDEPLQTDWGKVCLGASILFLTGLEKMVVALGEWPYMKQIDPEATTSFFGLATGISRAAHAIFTVVFSFWCYKTKSVRKPLIAGRAIGLFSFLLYLCVEIFPPENRRFVLAICYSLTSVGQASVTLIRPYFVDASHVDDRSRVFAVKTGAFLLAVVFGPVFQLAFTAINYPGLRIFGEKFLLNLYTAPIWIAVCVNVISLVILSCFFCESTRHAEEKNKEKSTVPQGIVSRIRRAIFDGHIIWTLVFLIWGQKMIVYLNNMSMNTISAPLLMVGSGWDGSKTVQVLSTSRVIVGLMSVGMSAAIIFGDLRKYMCSRATLLAALIVICLFYIVTYPLPFQDQLVAGYNATTNTGCNPSVYNWCDSTVVTPYLYVAGTVAVTGFGVPFAIISIDTLYSNILGKIDQSIMQGALVLLDDMMQVVTAIYSADLFTYNGQHSLWIVNGTITLGAVIALVVLYKRLEKFT